MADRLNIESQLVLYLAGELPEAERARFEDALKRDRSLRGQLESLSAAKQSVDEAIGGADRSDAMEASQLAAAVRQTSRAMRQWQVDQLARQPRRAEQRAWRIDWRAYAVATAASVVILIGVTVWWQSSEPPAISQVATTDEDEAADEFASHVERCMLSPAARNVEMQQAEREMDQLTYLAALSRRGENDDVDLETR